MKCRWVYRENKGCCALLDGEETIAEILIERGRKKRIITGLMMWLRPNYTNHLDVFEGITTVPGLTDSDKRDLILMQSGFFRVEGYNPHQIQYTKVTFMYNTDPRRQEQIEYEVEQLKQQKRKRLEDLIAESPEILYSLYEVE